MSMPRFSDRSLLVALAVNALLAASAGAMVGGLAGAQLGLAGGLVVTVLPRIARVVTARLARPDGLPRNIGREIAGVALAAGMAAIAVGDVVVRPLRRLLRLPALALAIAVDIAARLARETLSAVGRIVSTPLGIANLAAFAVIVAAVAGVGLASSVTLVALVLLVLVLLVDQSERRDAAENPSREGDPS